ncbi:MAG: ATP-binding protein, partial [Cyclobacteriaceae bacterium]|nr:ATP-binding protein [Cyclobacteriaceae bacterium]
VRNRFLKKAARSLDGLDNLVKDLLILSQIETRNVQMDFEYFDILRLTKDVAGQFENKLQKKNIRIKISSSLKRQVVVFGDWQRIRQVLNNLISNAITYSNEGGFIEINLKKQEKTALLSVRDSGIGIPEKDLERIFERFYRVDKSRSRDSGGTGLGLAIVKHIMECHNQKINVKSSLDSGTIFSFHLPLKEEDF